MAVISFLFFAFFRGNKKGGYKLFCKKNHWEGWLPADNSSTKVQKKKIAGGSMR